ncbi:MAG: protein tyrosine phosphatase [Planctomycetes bacterium]|nr:protein tyrosine phosphatase [Planctomycetota bacterium]
MKKLLFVCSRNQWRSKTAEHLFRGRPGISVRSAGTASSARIRVTQELLNWADVVFLMEPKHAAVLRKRFGFRGALCLDIPDAYPFMDPELVELLEGHLEAYLT